MDKKTFENLVKDHSPSLRNYAMKFCNSGMPVEDLMQETFLRAWKYDGLREDGNPRSWLISILKRENYRQFDTLWGKSPPDSYDEMERLSTEQLSRPFWKKRAEVERKMTKEIDFTDEVFLNQLLDKLPKIKQEMALLHLSGYNNREIAEKYGMSKNTVAVWFMRFINKLQNV